MAEQPRPLWDINELADYLGVSVKPVRHWRQSGGGPPAARIGKHLRWQPAAVEAWVAAAHQSEAA